jgi:CDP-2,3-bis-(O-geranylgeranyl)-sn-glycerol synthase
MHNIWFALWFFSPAGIANLSPTLTSRIKALKFLYKPLDFGSEFRDKRIFGDNKTWLGLIGGIIFGTITIYLQRYGFNHSEWLRSISGKVDYDQTKILLLGPLMGFGALAGDAVESFFKRQIGIKPGRTWFPFDQIDYIVGGLLLSLPIIILNWSDYFYVLIVWVLIHILFSYIGYLIGFKKSRI